MNRDYDASVGRYVESDPIGLDGGVNTFGYVGGNPLSYVDQSGLAFTTVDATCMRDPKFCADVFGQMAENTARATQGDCLTQEQQDALDALHKMGTVASYVGIAHAAVGMAHAAAGVVRGMKRVAGRGLSDLGGIFSKEENAVGGTVVTSQGLIKQPDFEGYINSAMAQGKDVNILTGAHGRADGFMEYDSSMTADDIQRFGHMEGVAVYDIGRLIEMGAAGEAQIRAMLRSTATTIGGFCNSGACLAPFR